jgi:hypothetical protein
MFMHSRLAINAGPGICAQAAVIRKLHTGPSQPADSFAAGWNFVWLRIANL